MDFTISFYDLVLSPERVRLLRVQPLDSRVTRLSLSVSESVSCVENSLNNIARQR